MLASCPRCGSRKFRLQKSRSWIDKLAEYLGTFRLRCLDCGYNYDQKWKFKDYLYAKCPRCLRMDLTYWSEQYYRAPLSITWKIAFGAKRIRCEACRHNFASFRLLKQKYKKPSERTAEERNPVRE